MTRTRRPSAQTLAVLGALAEAPEEWRYGYALCVQVGLQAGTMYPILMRLADRGLLETGWESGAPVGRPPRHLYRLSAEGREYAVAQAAASGAAPARTAATVRRGTGPRPSAV